MRKHRILGLTFMALLAVGAVASVNASATLPVFLPLATEANPVKFTGISGAATFLAGTTLITATSDESTGEFLSTALGDIDILALGSKSSGVACTGLGDTVSGSILFLGTFHLVYLLNLAAKHVGLASLGAVEK
jgi:hypothetical protein